MYKKCHEAIKENAKNQNCKKLLKLIQSIEEESLMIIYAYNRHFPSGLNFDEKNIKYIEIVDPILQKKLNIKLSIIKNEKETIVLQEYSQNQFYKIKPLEFVLITKRINSINKILKLVKNFNLDELPVL